MPLNKEFMGYIQQEFETIKKKLNDCEECIMKKRVDSALKYINKDTYPSLKKLREILYN